MNQLRVRAAAGQSVAENELNELRQQAQMQIESTLTPPQLSIWPQLVEPYYDFRWEGSKSNQSTDQSSAPDLQSPTSPNSGTVAPQPSN